MKKLFAIFIVSCLCFFSFGQSPKKVSTYLFAQYNNTIYDETKTNNPWGVGPGVQTFFNTQKKIQPTIELTGDIYLQDDKVLKTTSDGIVFQDIRGMINLFVGSCFVPAKNIYLSLTGGPSFISGQTHFGIKPSLGFYFSKSQKWTAKVSYLNIYNREKITNQDFGSFSLAIGFKMF